MIEAPAKDENATNRWDSEGKNQAKLYSHFFVKYASDDVGAYFWDGTNDSRLGNIIKCVNERENKVVAECSRQPDEAHND